MILDQLMLNEWKLKLVLPLLQQLLPQQLLLQQLLLQQLLLPEDPMGLLDTK